MDSISNILYNFVTGRFWPCKKMEKMKIVITVPQLDKKELQINYAKKMYLKYTIENTGEFFASFADADHHMRGKGWVYLGRSSDQTFLGKKRKLENFDSFLVYKLEFDVQLVLVQLVGENKTIIFEEKK